MTDDHIFWELLLDMPDIEAVRELQSRRSELIQRKTEITDYWRGRYVKRSEEDNETIVAIDLALIKVNEEIKFRNRCLDSVSWRNAVRAIYGEEGYLACREWIVMNDRKEN